MPTAIHDHALDHLRYIRETMQRAGSFTSVSGMGAIVAGFTALIAAPLAHSQPSPVRWLAVWVADAIVAATVGGIFMAGKARRQSTRLLSPLGRRFLLGFGAPILSAVVLTMVLFRAGFIQAIPGTWLLLYGAAFVTGGAFSVRIVPVMGMCFMALGLITFFSDFGQADVMLAAGFGLLHLIFGFIIARRYGG